MSDSTEPSRTRRSLARPKCWSALAAVFALCLTEIPVAAQQSQDSGPPFSSVRLTQTPYAATSAPTAPAAPFNNGRKSLELYNEGTVACRFRYDAAPTATTGQPLPAGIDFHMDANAVTPQSVWISCPQATQIDVIEGQ